MFSVRSLMLAVGSAVVLWALPAHAGKSGVVLAHGTGDYDGTLSCTNVGTWKCVVSNAVTNYWTQAEVDSLVKRSDGTTRPYAVIGCKFGTRRPWANGTEPAEADCLATQVETFLKGPDGIFGNTDDITDIVIIGHSGASNHIRFVLQQYAASTARTRVKNATRKAVTVAPVHKGTYLANVAVDTGTGKFINGAMDFLAGSSYNDDGTKFIRTYEMTTYNADAAKLVNLSNPINGITLRSTAATYPDAAVWDSKAWCGNYSYAVALNTLHRLYLGSGGTDTNGCSDGFIPCKSAAAMGQVFFGSTDGTSGATTGTARFRNHQQTRRQCNGADTAIRAEVNSTTLPYTDVPDSGDTADKATVASWDACQFSVAQPIVGASPWRTAGCSPDRLGNGKCDWDCFAVYGRDAVPTWSAGVGSTVTAWGTDDCTIASTKSAWSTTFSGNVDADAWQEISKTQWTSTCDPAWINDGECDECWVALAGSDGNDCRPGRMSVCVGNEVDETNYDLDTDWTWAYMKRGAWTLNATPAHGNGKCEWNECTTYPSDCTGLCD